MKETYEAALEYAEGIDLADFVRREPWLGFSAGRCDWTLFRPNNATKLWPEFDKIPALRIDLGKDEFAKPTTSPPHLTGENTRFSDFHDVPMVSSMHHRAALPELVRPLEMILTCRGTDEGIQTSVASRDSDTG